MPPPRGGALSDDAVWRLWRISGRRATCAAGRPAGWMARIGWSGPARPAWLKAAAARFRCRPGRGISRRPPALVQFSLSCSFRTQRVQAHLFFRSERTLVYARKFGNPWSSSNIAVIFPDFWSSRCSVSKLVGQYGKRKGIRPVKYCLSNHQKFSIGGILVLRPGVTWRNLRK